MKLFGTDGIRGQANVDPMSVDMMLRVGRAAACVFRRREEGPHKVLIGKDTRLSGYMFETALTAGLSSMGVDVLLVGPIPTPGIAFLTADMRADAGIVISASHNPYFDNGIKFFGPDGYKLADAVEESIEKLAGNQSELDASRPAGDQIGKVYRLEDAPGRYIASLKHCFPRELDLDGVRIVMDCAHGAAYHIAPTVFEELGAQVVTIGAQPNGKNINDQCGALFPDVLAQKVKEVKADFGVALDGDADRVIFSDENGKIFDGDDVLALLSVPMKKRNELKGGVVGTVMTNFGLERFCCDRGIPFYRAPVGDRYVVELMKNKGAMLGGEPSGHLVALGYSTTGDGILTALLVAAEIIRSKKKMSWFSKQWSRFPQILLNVAVKEKKPLETLPQVSASIRSAEAELNDAGRVLVRYSGTESKARVMVEGKEETLVRQLAKNIANSIEAEIGG